MKIRIHERPAPLPGAIVLRERIRTDWGEKSALLERAVALLARRLRLDKMGRFRARLCFDEALQNAFEHGNGGDPAKAIELTVFESRDRWGFIVSDEGDGFGDQDVPDPDDPESLYRECGRGILILCRYMDEVSYYDGGRTVVLIQSKRHAASTPGEGAGASNRVEATGPMPSR